MTPRILNISQAPTALTARIPPRPIPDSRRLGQDLGNIRAGRRNSPQGAADRQELVPALPAYRIPVEVPKLVDRAQNGVLGGRDRGRRVAMGAADRLGDDLVDDA